MVDERKVRLMTRLATTSRGKAEKRCGLISFTGVIISAWHSCGIFL